VRSFHQVLLNVIDDADRPRLPEEASVPPRRNGLRVTG